MKTIHTNGRSLSDFGLRLVSREAPPPASWEVKESVFGKQGAWDFSNILGESVKMNRTITYVAKGFEFDTHRKRLNKTLIDNWLLTGEINRLYDDFEPNYYYMGKCVSVELSSDNATAVQEYTLIFDCYPYKVSELPEGHDVWDNVNFELDVLQPTTFEIEKMPFVPLKVGSIATLTAWATNYYGGTAISRQLVGESYRITDITYEGSSLSNISYKLQGVDGWVLEQDIVQAQGDGTEICLYNNGSTSLAPVIDTSYPTSILFNKNVFNAWKGSGTSELFRLSIGENRMKVYTLQPATIKFGFHKELI